MNFCSSVFPRLKFETCEVLENYWICNKINKNCTCFFFEGGHPVFFVKIYLTSSNNEELAVCQAITE